MKKFILTFLICFISIFSYSQTINYSKPYIEFSCWSFNVPTSSIGELGFMHICCDKQNKNFWLKYWVITPYNVDEIVDDQGRHVCGKYTINVGKHIYLKLDNDEIITLTCKYRSKIHIDYYVGSTDVYKQYDMYSYFLLNTSIIEN